jgi:hypothetical protein
MKINLKKTKDWFFYWVVVGFGLSVLFLLITSVWIGFSVKEKCVLAQGRYGGDCVGALSDHLEDENNPYGERNDAIWALGQLGDGRALLILEKYYTGVIPDREPWDETISQYELKKAIDLTRGGFNITSYIWRYNFP